MSSAPHPWKELSPRQIERALQGGRRDLDALIRWYGPVVWAAVAARARKIPRLAVPMEDLVSEVWLELCRGDLKRLRYYDPQRGEFGYFIRMQAAQITWNLILAQLRRPELVAPPGAEPVDDRREQQLLDRDLLERFAARARASLGPSDWALFVAAYVEGLSSEQAAQRMDKKVATVYQQKYRLRAKLDAIVRELLEAEEPGRPPSDALVQLMVVSLLALAPVLDPSPASVDSVAMGVEQSLPEPLDPQ